MSAAVWVVTAAAVAFVLGYKTGSHPPRAPDASSFELRGNGAKAWFGWPDDEELERLRTAWFDAPDLPAQKAIAEKVQMRALETLPCIPLGQLFQPTAFRSDIRDIVKAAFPLFWGVRRA